MLEQLEVKSAATKHVIAHLLMFYQIEILHNIDVWLHSNASIARTAV